MTILRELVEASEAALPIIREMFDAFPYAEKDGDDTAMTRLWEATRAGRASLASADTHPKGEDPTKIGAEFMGSAVAKPDAQNHSNQGSNP